MNDSERVSDLEAALLERAERLAGEYLEKGTDGRESILKEEQDRLQSREQRIVDEASANSDRLYRRRVQAAELRNHGDLDRERWHLIQSVVEELPRRLADIVESRSSYEELLKALLAEAAKSIDDDELIARLSARDVAALAERWTEFCDGAVPGKKIVLSPDAIECSGGVRVSSRDNSVSVDATFEGRIERFQDELTQTIAERLFSRSGGLSHG